MRPDPGAESLAGNLVLRALERQRRRTNRILAQVRLAGVLAGLGLVLVMAYGAAQSDWRPMVPVLAVYALAAFLLQQLTLPEGRGGRWSGVFVALVDVPMVFWMQWVALPVSPSASGVAGFSVGIFVLLVLLGALSLSIWQTLLVMAAATVGAVLLQVQAGVRPGSWAATVVVLACSAIAAAYLIGRVRALVTTVAGEQRQRERLGRYCSPSVAERLHDQALLSVPAAQELTVLFADIRDFTRLAETLSPGDVVSLLNEFDAPMVECIFEHGGTLDKFIGDGIMAYFGAPLPDPEHALHATECAMAMQAALAALNVARCQSGKPPLQMGIGLNSGVAVLGDVGSPAHRLDYTAIGDTVNVASRIEGLTKVASVPVLVSAATRERVGDRYAWQAIGPLAVRGKKEPVAVFAPLGRGVPEAEAPLVAV